MAVISAKALFHFTKSKETLFKIIANGFRPSYSAEFGPVTGGRINPAYIPMCCFCDLPLSSLKFHMFGDKWKHNGNEFSSSGYGNYGLGMTKEWGKLKGLNPVLYMNYNVEANYLNTILEAMNALKTLYLLNRDKVQLIKEHSYKAGITEWQELDPIVIDYVNMFYGLRETMQNVHNCFSYYKPYEDLTSGQIYYNEREWRYVVPNDAESVHQIPVIFPLSFPKLMDKKDDLQQMITDNYMLKFEPEDIKYIIIDSEDDIEEIVDQMKQLPHKYSNQQINKLLPRMIKNEQIRDDS